MCQKALCQRVNFYLERELPEEIQKYEEREKRRKNIEYEEKIEPERKQKKKKEGIEKQFREYINQYN